MKMHRNGFLIRLQHEMNAMPLLLRFLYGQHLALGQFQPFLGHSFAVR